MGNWKLEVGRMGIYMIFPVMTFYVFNQPQWFEEFTIAKKKEIFQPITKENSQLLKDCIQTLQEKKEKEMLELLSKDKV